jgi:hypothetical protein
MSYNSPKFILLRVKKHHKVIKTLGVREGVRPHAHPFFGICIADYSSEIKPVRMANLTNSVRE